MKKIYSFMLMATMLLIGINANAADFTSAAALQDALNGAADGATIQLNGNLSIDDTIKLDLGEKAITLDLTGDTISASAAVDMIYLYRGKLTVKNGVIRHETSTTGNPLIFKVFGTGEKVIAGNYTHLTINSDVELKVAGGKTDAKGYGISINERDAITDPTSLPSTKVNDVALANGIQVDVYGKIQMLSDKGYCVKVNGSIKYAPANWAALGVTNPTTADTTEWVACAPHVYLHPGSYLRANDASSGVGAIYAAGYGVWDIRCVAEGSCALAAKSGVVNVANATLRSTSTTYDIPEGLSAGVATQGTAVLIESNSSYPGHTQVTFSGDTRVEAVSGYAIEEVLTTSATTKVSSVTIDGGTFVGGNDTQVSGCIYFEDETIEDAEISIGGGSYTAQTMEQQTATQTLLETLLGNHTPSDPAYTIEVNNGGASQTGTSIVISKTEIPTAVEEEYTFAKLQTAALNNEDVNLEKAQVEGGELEIAADIELQNLYMNSNSALSIIIPNGITMQAKRIVMGNNDNITVKAGGKLVIYGDQGLSNVKNENLIIEAEEGNMGIFLYKPTVATNRHPHAIVQLISKAYHGTDRYVWQRFGIPAYQGFLKGSIVKVGHSYATAYMYWNNEAKDWASVAADQLMLPFEGYTMTSAADENHRINKYAMPCDELYGSINAPLEFVPGWNYHSNSYTAKAGIYSIIAKLMESNDVMEGAIHIHTSSTNNYWDPISAEDIEKNEVDINIALDPMQCFVTKNRTKNTDEEILYKDTFNYETMVWDYYQAQSNAAPARRNVQVSDYTKAIVVISNGENEQKVTLRQGAEYSSEFENGADVTSLKMGDFSIYANAEIGDMAQIATDNLMGQTLSIESAKAASFKMTFKGLKGETLAIRDNMTGSVINMTEGEEYFFSVAPGTTADRFEIVEAAKMPTDVEMLEAAPAKKGIYTLVGQYLGENFDVLPAGIYVVNGKKVVK